MLYRAKLKGSGTAEIAAYGAADAEATVQKELRRALPGATVDVRGIRRLDEEPRIVEEFLIEYLVMFQLEVTGEDETSARRSAFTRVRAGLKSTRYEKVSWQSAELSLL